MKHIIVALFFQCVSYLSSAQQYDNVQMGKGFSYLRNGTSSEIVFLPSYKDTTTHYFSSSEGDTASKVPIPRIVWVTVSDVSSFGFNDDYVLVTSKSRAGISYWVIDKRKETESKGMTKDESRRQFSNVSQVDAATHSQLQQTTQIKLHSVEGYRSRND